MATDVQDGTPLPAAIEVFLYPWMWPAWVMGRIRPGLREATAGDAFRLMQWRPLLGAVVLPVLAIGVPLVLSILHGTTPTSQQGAPETFDFVINDVFTESIPFMAAALALGLIAPSLGVLVVLVYGVGNLAVTVISGELVPTPAALFSRLISFWLLWALVVDIPLMARMVVEWRIRDEEAGAARRVSGIVLGAIVIACLTFIWVQAAPLLITVVFWLTAIWGAPFLAAVAPLQLSGMFVVAAAGAASLMALAARFLGPSAVLDPPVLAARSIVPGGPVAAYLLSVALGFVFLFSVIEKPIDAAILLTGLVLARPVARIVLRVTRLAPALASIPPPIRLVMGFGLAVAVAWVFIAIVGISDVTRFFNMVIAIALGIVAIEIFLAADDEVEAHPPGGTVIAATATMALLTLAVVAVMLVLPAIVLADNGGSQSDGWPDFLNAAYASGAAGVFGLMSRRFVFGWRAWKPGQPPPKQYSRDWPLSSHRAMQPSWRPWGFEAQQTNPPWANFNQQHTNRP